MKSQRWWYRFVERTAKYSIFGNSSVPSGNPYAKKFMMSCMFFHTFPAGDTVPKEFFSRGKRIQPISKSRDLWTGTLSDDGLVRRILIFLRVQTADCAPWHFLGTKRFGIVHAGWREFSSWNSRRDAILFFHKNQSPFVLVLCFPSLKFKKIFVLKKFLQSLNLFLFRTRWENTVSFSRCAFSLVSRSRNFVAFLPLKIITMRVGDVIVHLKGRKYQRCFTSFFFCNYASCSSSSAKKGDSGKIIIMADHQKFMVLLFLPGLERSPLELI